MTRYEVQGDDALARSLRTLGNDLEDLSSEHAVAARRLSSAASRRAPRRSGALAGSITAAPTAAGLAVESRLPYAGVQEWGWSARHIVGRHYLGAGWDETRAAIVEDVAGGIRKRVGKVRGA